MAIQHRRGADKDFDANKMLPGEIAVTTDGTRKVYAAFAAGDVKELVAAEDVEKYLGEYVLDESLTDNSKAAPAGVVGEKFKTVQQDIKKLKDDAVQLDETLTDSTKAAPANLVGELKQKIEKIQPGGLIVSEDLNGDIVIEIN